jgi:hypothetical protein
MRKELRMCELMLTQAPLQTVPKNSVDFAVKAESDAAESSESCAGLKQACTS